MARLLTTIDVAEELAMSLDWVREHAAELGGIRLGGERGPLRFEPERIADYKERRRLAPPPRRSRKPHRPGRRPAPNGVRLLPIPGER